MKVKESGLKVTLAMAEARGEGGAGDDGSCNSWALPLRSTEINADARRIGREGNNNQQREKENEQSEREENQARTVALSGDTRRLSATGSEGEGRGEIARKQKRE